MKTEKEKSTPSYEDVTIADVKECKAFEKVSDEMAQGIADAIRIYTEVIYNCFVEGKLQNKEAKIVTLHREQIKKAA